MHRNWSQRNVNLNALKEKLNELLKENIFDVNVIETQGSYQLLAKNSPNYHINGQIIITIEGKPEEFSITIDLQKKKESKILSSPITMALLGAGYFLSQRFRSDEAWIEFKRDFWEYTDRIVTELSGSAE